MEELLSWWGVAAVLLRFVVLMLGLAILSIVFGLIMERFAWPRRVRTERGLIVVYESGATFLSDSVSGQTYSVVNGAPKPTAYDGMDR